jgi:hypothetical protein
MKKLLTHKKAATVALSFLAMLILYHLLILTSIISYENVWAGKLKTLQQMYQFEGISIVMTILISWFIAMRSEILKPLIPQRFISVLMWLLVVIFTLNTLGNLQATSQFEKFVFTPITILLTLLSILLALKNSRR